MMDLNILWFVLIAVLFVGFFFLEGFDFGVGMLLPFIGKDDRERRVVINSIGPFWDGNEVWLLTAGGAMFAAFPHWYATLFSGFYLALVLMLFALIVRGGGLRVPQQGRDPRWRNVWDWAIFVGSLVPALLWGVAMANLMRGVPIDAEMNYVGGFFNLLSPYALLGGVAFVALFLAARRAVPQPASTEGASGSGLAPAASRLWLPRWRSSCCSWWRPTSSTDIFTAASVTGRSRCCSRRSPSWPRAPPQRSGARAGPSQ